MISKFTDLIEMPLIEFHLSYSDMELDPGDFWNLASNLLCAPELFKDSHLMDLASNNVAYRQQSIAETQRVINITISKFFPTERPLIVANIGGFSMDKPF